MFKRFPAILSTLAMLFAMHTTTSHAQSPLPARQQSPVGSFSAYYVYDLGFSNPPYDTHNRSLMGWEAVPAFNLTKHIAWFGDGTSLYMRSVYPGQTRLSLQSGFSYSFAAHHKATPFVFVEGGEVRISQQYNPLKDWNPVASGGIGFNVPLSHSIAFSIVPAQYVAQYQDNHSWGSNFVAKAGIVFNLYK